MESIIRLNKGEVFCLSSIVAQELYAGSKDKKFTWHMDKLYYRLKKTVRLIVPNSMDWRNAGLALSRLGNRHGYQNIRIAALVNDALIATSCRREGALLLTLNEKDFKLLQEEIDFDYQGI